MAEEAGISRSSMACYIKGTRRPSQDAVERLRKAIGCTEAELPTPVGARPKKAVKSAPSPEHDQFTSDFAQRLRYLMAQNGLSINSLAAVSGLSPTAVSRYAAGQREPMASSVVVLAKGLGVSADVLLGTAQRSQRELTAAAVHQVASDAASLDGPQRRVLLRALAETAG